MNLALLLALFDNSPKPVDLAAPLPAIADSQRAEFWRASHQMSEAILQCEPCQVARVARNQVIVELQKTCGSVALIFDEKGEPACKGAAK
jgi:hypothetical protein